MEAVNFYGEYREVEVWTWFQNGTTVFGMTQIDGVMYVLFKQQSETIWYVSRRWS